MVVVGVGRRTSQDGPWLPAGWKSNMSQQKVKVEFIEERERERGSEHLEDLKRKRAGVSSLFGVWGFY